MYDVTNLATGRKVVFRSAQRFRWRSGDGPAAAKIERLSFDSAWQRLSEAGACDAIDGEERHRVHQEWLQAGNPANVAEFIYRRANVGPEGQEPSPEIVAERLREVFSPPTETGDPRNCPVCGGAGVIPLIPSENGCMQQDCVSCGATGLLSGIGRRQLDGDC